MDAITCKAWGRKMWHWGAENVAKIGVWERKMWHWGAENVQKSL